MNRENVLRDVQSRRAMAWTAICAAFMGIAVSLVVTLSSAHAEGAKVWQKNEARPVAKGATSNESEKAVAPPDPAQKICRAWIDKQFSTALIFPRAWGPPVCQDLRKHSGALVYALGCGNSAGMWFGAEGGALPIPNCGW